MANKKKRDDDWAEAKRRCQLNQDDIRMAKELGMNPRSLVRNIPAKSQQWKAPVKYWIRDLYEKHQMKIRGRKPSTPASPPPTLSKPASEVSVEPIPSDAHFLEDDPIPF